MILVFYVICLVAIIYFLLVRPQQKRKKHLANLVNSLKVNTEVITVGGLHGIVVEKNQGTVVLQGRDCSLLEFEIAAIAKVCGDDKR